AALVLSEATPCAGVRAGSATYQEPIAFALVVHKPLPEWGSAAASPPRRDQTIDNAFAPCETRSKRNCGRRDIARILRHVPGANPMRYGGVVGSSPGPNLGRAKHVLPAGIRETGRGSDKSPETAW